MSLLPNCLHDLSALGAGGMAALAGALFVAGLVSGATHCAAMCAPFVLAQLGDGRHAGGGTLRRLSGAALLPYHCGRMIGYALLGAVVGTGAGLLTDITGLRWVLALLLGVGAVLMLAQAAERTGLPRLPLPSPSLPTAMQAPLGRLLAAPHGCRGVLLGLLLSALPCGMLYAALAASGAAGSALGGAIGMGAFAAGTMPGLMAVALLGRIFQRAGGRALRRWGAALCGLNAVMLGTMAGRMLS